MKSPYRPLENLKISGNLPSMPQVLVQLIDACHSPSADLKKISRIVAKDATISAKVLQLVNSAYIGLRKNFTDTNQAAVYLGTDVIKNLAISISVQQVFRRVETNALLSMDRFWYHSFQNALISQKLAESIAYPTPGDAYLAGLLHDIGKLLLWMAFPGKYAPLLLKGIRCHDARLAFLEQEKLDINHCQAGGWLCEQWNLPSLLADAIKYHHHPIEELKQALPLPQIIATSDIISHNEPDNETSLKAAEQLMGLSKDQLISIYNETDEEVEQVATQLGIKVPSHFKSSLELDNESEDVHKETSLGLINRVRDITQLTGSLESLLKSENIEQILTAVEQNLKILFNETKSLFFLWDNDNETNLQAKVSSTNELFSGVEHFFLNTNKEGTSILEQALITRKLTHSFSTPDETQKTLSILDQQLISLLGTEGFAAFPLVYKDSFLGLLILGLKAEGQTTLQSHLTPLHLLLQHTAIAIFLEKHKQQHAERLLKEQINSASLVARKVAHEINNPVAILQNYVHILKLKDKEEKIDAELSIIEEELNRIAQLTGQLQDLGNENQVSHVTKVDINNIIHSVLALYKNSNEATSKITIEFTPDLEIPNALADENGIRQVLQNLINNAKEAIAETGIIDIKTTCPDTKLIISITDNGMGITPTQLKAIFSPGVTTKHNGHSGLGLAITKKVLNDIGGTITCESGENNTTFSVSLPTETT